MSRLILPGRVTQQPSGAVQIDWTNPLTRGLVWVTLPNELYVGQTATEGLRNVVNPSPAYPAYQPYNNATLVGTPRGRALAIGNQASRAYYTGMIAGPVNLTMMSWFYRRTSDPTSQWTNFRSDNNHTLDIYSSTSSNITWGADWVGSWNGAGSQQLNIAEGFVIIGAAINSSGARFFHQGRFSGLKTGSAVTIPQPTYIDILGNTTASSVLGQAAWNRALTDVEMRSFQENPYQIYKPVPHVIQIMAIAGGGTGAALQSSIACSSVATAALTTKIALGSSISAVCATSATLASAIKLSASLSSAPNISGSLSSGIALSAASAVSSISSADLTTQAAGANLVASSSVTSIATAALTSSIQLGSVNSCTVSTTAQLSSSIRLAATVSATVLTAASLSAPGQGSQLQASVVNNCSTSASLATQITLASSVAETVTSSVSLSSGIPLSASISSAISAVASLTALSSGLSATSSANCSATAALSSAIVLSASITQTATTSAVLQTAVQLIGSSSIVSNAVAVLKTGINLAATASVSPITIAAINSEITLSASGACSPSTYAALNISFAPLTASVGCNSSIIGNLSSGIQLSSQVQAAAQTSANLITYILLSASSNCSSTVYARLFELLISTKRRVNVQAGKSRLEVVSPDRNVIKSRLTIVPPMDN